MSFRLALNRAGVSKSRLAERSGVDLGQISRYDHGRQEVRRSSYDVVERMARVLNLYPHEFVAICEGRRHAHVGNGREHREHRAAR
jgi:transcriptional regulator with XRE-family HTH domain